MANQRLINSFLNGVQSTTFPEDEITWQMSGWDNGKLAGSVIDEFKKYKIKTVLDISCGAGEFLNVCGKYDIKAFGIDPRIGNIESYQGKKNQNINHENAYKGTFNTIIANQKLLKNTKFDCITIFNTLHGHWSKGIKVFSFGAKENLDDGISTLLKFIIKYSKYIVMSDIQKQFRTDKEFFYDNVEFIKEFAGSHGGNKTIHKLYKVKK